MQPVQAVEAESSAVEPMVAPEAVDHSENADTATEEVESTGFPEADQQPGGEDFLQILLFF